MPPKSTGDAEIIEWVNERLTDVLLLATGVVIGGNTGLVAAGDIIYGDTTPLWAIRSAGVQNTILSIDGTGVPVWTAEVALASLADPTRGDVMIGNSTPQWSGLAVGAADTVLISDGTDPAWQTSLPLAAVPAHNLLSAQHGDTVASSRTRGDLVVATAAAWDDLALGSSGDLLRSDGIDVEWSTTIPTPGTLTVSTVNAGTAPHLHTITSSSDPGSAASLLASAADGGLELLRFGVGIDPSVDGQIHIYEDSTSIVPKLKIEQDGTGDTALNFLLTGGDQFSMGIDNSLSGNPFIISAGADLASTPLFTIESGGFVGIGTTNPDRRLHIVADEQVLLTVDSYVGSTAGTQVSIRKSRGTASSPSAVNSADTLGIYSVSGHDGTNFAAGALLAIVAREAWTGSAHGTSLDIRTATTGATSTVVRMRIRDGVTLTTSSGTDPTGGDKGAGTLNVAGDVYKNNTAYTNPDYVFEHHFTGKIELHKDKPGAAGYKGLRPLSELEDYVSEHFHLPTISRESAGIFQRGDWLLAEIETLYLHIFKLNNRLSMLE